MSQFKLSHTTIKIVNLMLRTIIGFNEWERTQKQDIVINIEMGFYAGKALESDNVEDTLDYKKVKRLVIDLVENSTFNLLESLTHAILEKIMEINRVRSAWIKVEKPHALRFAQSVSVEMSAEREE